MNWWNCHSLEPTLTAWCGGSLTDSTPLEIPFCKGYPLSNRGGILNPSGLIHRAHRRLEASSNSMNEAPNLLAFPPLSLKGEEFTSGINRLVISYMMSCNSLIFLLVGKPFASLVVAALPPLDSRQGFLNLNHFIFSSRSTKWNKRLVSFAQRFTMLLAARARDCITGCFRLFDLTHHLGLARAGKLDD